MDTAAVRTRRITVAARWLIDLWWLIDLCLAFGLAVLALALAALGGGVGAIALDLIQTLPLGWRRRVPALVLAVTGLASLGDALLAQPGLPAALTPALALYSLATSASRRSSGVGLALAGAATTAAILIAAAPVSYIAMSWCVLTTAWAVGMNAQTRRAYLAELRARAEWLAADRERGIALAASAERHRIARELHDVVTHNVTVMVIGAGAGRIATNAGPERLRAELATIEQTGRETLRELRSLLGVLRIDDDADHPCEPQPGLSRLDALVDRTRAAGLPVDLAVHGPPRSLPQGIDVSAFHIVREALSNTLRHGGPCTAKVDVRYEPDALRLTVRDTGRGQSSPGGDGHGLVGMRERVALAGGELRAGPAAGGGFEITALLPLTDT